MKKSVIVRRPVAFVSTYKNKILEFRDEYQKWIMDNFGYEARYEYRYTMIESMVYFEFTFKTAEDAVAFKLRWT